MKSGAHRLHAARTAPAGPGQSPDRIAESAERTWREIHAALSPVIGDRGVQALFRRTLLMTRAAHPWLEPGRDVRGPDEYADLRAALAQQTSPIASAGQDTLLQNFLDLLTSLIGESLTERLLRAVWADVSGDDATRDTTP